MLNQVTAQEAVRFSNKDVGSVDANCFQILLGEDVITLKASTVSEKRQWLNQLQSAISYLKSARKRDAKQEGPKKHETIGTLEVILYESKNVSIVERGGKKLNIFAIVQVHQQVTKSRLVSFHTPKWNQSLMFSVTSLDDVLKIALYGYDKYAKDEYIGQAEVQMDILEYYVGKPTEKMSLQLRDATQGEIVVQMLYRLAK